MDGTLAAIFVIASLSDMTLNDCPTGCLSQSDRTARLGFQAADVQFQDESIGTEVMLSYDMNRAYGPFQPTFGISVDDNGDTWFGAGAKWTTQGIWSGPLFLEASLMPGVHLRKNGPDIGGRLHFRSALGAGYEFDGGATLTVSYDHRSNGDRLDLNPGLETLSVRYAIPF